MPSWHVQAQLHIFTFTLRLCEDPEGKGKDKVVRVPAMKAYRGSRGTAPLIFNIGTRWTLISQPCVCPTGGLTVLQKSSCPCRGTNPGASSPLHSHYTELPGSWNSVFGVEIKIIRPVNFSPYKPKGTFREFIAFPQKWFIPQTKRYCMLHVSACKLQPVLVAITWSTCKEAAYDYGVVVFRVTTPYFSPASEHKSFAGIYYPYL
jgi:hypothetical protein